jgi:tetratricopeptide (TPR) repeat protein
VTLGTRRVREPLFAVGAPVGARCDGGVTAGRPTSGSLPDRKPSALAILTRARRRLDDRADLVARRQRAQLLVWYGHLRQRQGRHADALRWCRRAIDEAKAADERDALAHAYWLLDWIHAERGEPHLAVHSQEAMALYEELDDVPQQASVSNNLGAIAYWRGDWQEALVHYERANELYERTGDVLGVAQGRNNIAEILADQGRWEEAYDLLQDVERVFRAAKVPSIVAYVRANLGRAAAYAGRHEEAAELLSDALQGTRDAGAGTQVLEAAARLAEVEVLRGRPDVALGHLDEALARAGSEAGTAAQEPLLHRVRGYALRQLGDTDGAHAAFTRSLDSAAARDADFDRALAQRALADLARITTGTTATALLAQSRATLARLGVERLPLPGPEADVGA